MTRYLLAVAVLCIVAADASAEDRVPLEEVTVEDGVSVLCVEAETGFVVFERDAQLRRPPASMVKMMLMLLVAEGVDAGDFTLDREIAASPHAQRMGGSQVYLRAGETIPLWRLMQAVAISSANDAAMAVAEGLWGSEEAYLERMNERARELGMVDSEFHSVHGLPPSPGEKLDLTTAQDMALLARECVRHGLIRSWTRQREYVFRPGEPPKHSTNKLLWRMAECDGLKTGFIRAAGFCVTATAQRDDLRLITVIMGHPNKNQRWRLAQEVFEYGFATTRRKRVIARGRYGRPVPVRYSQLESVTLDAAKDLWVTAHVDDFARLEFLEVAPQELEAPLAARAVVGEIQVLLDGRVVAASPLRVPYRIERGGWMWQIENRIRSFVPDVFPDADRDE